VDAATAVKLTVDRAKPTQLPIGSSCPVVYCTRTQIIYMLRPYCTRSRVCELRGADHDVGLSVRENAAATAAGLYTVANNDNNAKIVHGSELSRDGE